MQPLTSGSTQFLAPGTNIHQRYLIIRMMGKGGMGVVYEAFDLRLNILVALKQTTIGDARFNAAFEREAQLLAALRHPTLPRVIDHFVESKGQFLVMEFVSGNDLGTLLRWRSGSFTVAEVRPWAEQLLDALEYMHTRQPTIIHYDIKPENLKLNDEGKLFLLDFGLAKGASTHTQTTNARSMIGYSRLYAPLEQIQGSGTDSRSDLYALAATLYHLLVGTPPSEALARAAAAVLPERLDPLQAAHELNPQVPVAVGKALHTAMALNPAARPTSAKVMRDELAAAWQSTPPNKEAQVIARPLGRARWWVNKHARTPVALICIVVVFTVATSLYLFSSGKRFHAPQLDTFQRADGALGSHWLRGEAAAISGRSLVLAGSESVQYWAESFGAAQEAFYTVGTIGTLDPAGGGIDLLLKAQDLNGCNYIDVVYAPRFGGVQVTTCDARGWTLYGRPIPMTLQAGDKIGARVLTNGVVEVYINDTRRGQVSVADSPILAATNGRIGIWLTAVGTTTVTEFGGGVTE